MFLFFDALKDGFFHCCVIVFSISDDFIVENVDLSKKKKDIIVIVIVIVISVINVVVAE